MLLLLFLASAEAFSTHCAGRPTSSLARSVAPTLQFSREPPTKAKRKAAPSFELPKLGLPKAPELPKLELPGVELPSIDAGLQAVKDVATPQNAFTVAKVGFALFPFALVVLFCTAIFVGAPGTKTPFNFLDAYYPPAVQEVKEAKARADLAERKAKREKEKAEAAAKAEKAAEAEKAAAAAPAAKN